jgi:hypothetical protein
LEDVFAAHCRQRKFSEYFFHLMNCSDDEIYDTEWRTLLLAAVYSLCIILCFLDLLCCCEFILY